MEIQCQYYSSLLFLQKLTYTDSQVKGYKRWILFPPEDASYLYTFPSLHPSARQSQVNFNDPESSKIFPGKLQMGNALLILVRLR